MGADIHLPTVSCLLAVPDTSALAPAAKAVELFLDQVYPRKELIVANASGKRLLRQELANVRELEFAGPAREPVLWNLAVEQAVGQFVKVWNQNSDYATFLLSYLASNLETTETLLALECHVRVDLHRLHAYIHTCSSGIAETAMLPRTLATDLGWPDEPQGSEEELYLACRRRYPVRVLRNRSDLLPALEIYYVDGKASDRMAFWFPGRHYVELTDTWELPDAISLHLKRRLHEYGIQVVNAED